MSLYSLHIVCQKTRLLIFDHNLCKYAPIFEILRWQIAKEISQLPVICSFHLRLSAFLYFIVKLEN